MFGRNNRTRLRGNLAAEAVEEFDRELNERCEILRMLEEERELLMTQQNEVLDIKVKLLREGAKAPTKHNEEDSGWDLYAAEDVIIAPGETVVVPTGIAMALPKGYGATCRPRSGITSKTKIRVQLGTVDGPYRGEVGVIIDNTYDTTVDTRRGIHSTSKYAFTLNLAEAHPIDENATIGTTIIRKGDKIAQFVLERIYPSKVTVVDELDDTARGDGGFGSSGI